MLTIDRKYLYFLLHKEMIIDYIVKVLKNNAERSSGACSLM